MPPGEGALIATTRPSASVATRAIWLLVDAPEMTPGGASRMHAERINRAVEIRPIGGGAEGIMTHLAARQLGL